MIYLRRLYYFYATSFISYVQLEPVQNFPPGFHFSASTSAYQIEGGWNSDSKGPSIWDNFTHTYPEKILGIQKNADISCDSYHLYEEDVKYLKSIGFNMYRFSISWPRILPSGDLSIINKAGIDYYNKLIDLLLESSIEPMVTIYHWDLPQVLQDCGGWLNESIVDHYLNYANLLFKEFGYKIKWWITINEPIMIVNGYTTYTHLAPGLNLSSPADYIVAHNLLKSHGKVYRLYDSKYREAQKGRLSIAINSENYLPKSNSSIDRDAAEHTMQFQIGWFSHPIYSDDGDYPPIMKKRIYENSMKEGRSESRLPEFTEEEIDYLRGSYDFYALNHYTSKICQFSSGPFENLRAKDVGVTCSYDKSWPSSPVLAWFKVVPEGIRNIIVWISDHYNYPEIFITENGYADEGNLFDWDRVLYHQDYLTEVLNAVKMDKCNVIGYSAWSLIDNFEWSSGFNAHFGLVKVNFSDPQRERNDKLSAAFFNELIEENAIPQPRLRRKKKKEKHSH